MSANTAITLAPLATTTRLIRPAQYSFDHHSISLRRVSRPTAPPSASSSLAAECVDGAGDATREGIGVGRALPFLELEPDVPNLGALLMFLAVLTAVLAASVNVFLFPVPNLNHGWPGFDKCLFSWKIRHMSCWRFFLFSESTALSSRRVHDGAKSGEWKKEEKRASAPGKASVFTLK